MFNRENLSVFVEENVEFYQDFDLAHSTRQQALAQAHMIVQDWISLKTELNPQLARLSEQERRRFIASFSMELMDEGLAPSWKRALIKNKLGYHDKQETDIFISLSDTRSDLINMKESEWREFISSELNTSQTATTSSTSSSSSSTTQLTSDQKIRLLSEQIQTQETRLSSLSDEKQKERLTNAIKLNKELLQNYVHSAPNTPALSKRTGSTKNVSLNTSLDVTQEIEHLNDMPAQKLWEELHLLYDSTASQNFASQEGELKALLMRARDWEDQRDVVLKTDDNDRSLIHLAAPYSADLIKVVKVLAPSVQSNAINRLDNTGKSAWHYAALDVAGLQFLNSIAPNSTFASICKADKNAMTVLHHAASNEHATQYLLNLYPEDKKLAAILLRDSHGMTVLHHAAINHSHVQGMGSNVLAINFLLNQFPAESRLSALTQADLDGFSVFHLIVKETPANLLADVMNALLKTLPATDQQAATEFLNSDVYQIESTTPAKK